MFFFRNNGFFFRKKFSKKKFFKKNFPKKNFPKKIFQKKNFQKKFSKKKFSEKKFSKKKFSEKKIFKKKIFQKKIFRKKFFQKKPLFLKKPLFQNKTGISKKIKKILIFGLDCFMSRADPSRAEPWAELSRDFYQLELKFLARAKFIELGISSSFSELPSQLVSSKIF